MNVLSLRLAVLFAVFSGLVLLAFGSTSSSSSCAEHTTCDTCREDFCGWCAADATCKDMDADDNGECPETAFITFSSGQCLVQATCQGEDCLEVYNTFFSTEPCDGAPDQTCTYANAYFVMKSGDAYVTDLDESEVEMLINGRSVGVEGQKSLQTSTGLNVKLLLDASYSITEAGAGDTVRDSARTFIESLPAEARIAVATFASEARVPIYLCADGTSGDFRGHFGTPEEALDALTGYQPHSALTSAAQTKLYDAVAGFAAMSSDEPPNHQTVLIAFTDGADTASSDYDTPSSVRSTLAYTAAGLRIHAVSLGNDVDLTALGELADDEVAHAADAAELEAAFSEIAAALNAIYRLRILVAEAIDDAEAEIQIRRGDTELNSTFEVSVYGSTEPVQPVSCQ